MLTVQTLLPVQVALFRGPKPVGKKNDMFRVYAKLLGTISKSVLEDCCSAFGIKSLVSIRSTRNVASLYEVCSVFFSDVQIEIKMLKLKLGQK